MGYNTDVYKLKDDGKLEFMYAAQGSDCPSYFENIKTWKDAETVFNKLKNETVVWMYWPCVWKTSQTSDDCIILEGIERIWYQFWKPKISIKVWTGVYYEKWGDELSDDKTKLWFSDISPNEHYDESGEEDWKTDHLRLFELPIMK